MIDYRGFGALILFLIIIQSSFLWVTIRQQQQQHEEDSQSLKQATNSACPYFGDLHKQLGELISAIQLREKKKLGNVEELKKARVTPVPVCPHQGNNIKVNDIYDQDGGKFESQLEADFTQRMEKLEAKVKDLTSQVVILRKQIKKNRSNGRRMESMAQAPNPNPNKPLDTAPLSGGREDGRREDKTGQLQDHSKPWSGAAHVDKTEKNGKGDQNVHNVDDLRQVECRAPDSFAEQMRALIVNGSGNNFSEKPHLTAGQPTSCSAVKAEPLKTPVRQRIFPDEGFEDPPSEGVMVLCDFETDGGGWTIIQRRTSGPKEDFNRVWAEYDRGFGSLDGNFWLGLKHIHALTKHDYVELRVDLWNWENNHAYAKYSHFAVSNSSDNYRLSVCGHSGTARDAFEENNVNGVRFETKDVGRREKPKWMKKDFFCFGERQGGWWHTDICDLANLNGFYYQKGEKADPVHTGVFWHTWGGIYTSLRQVEMKVRTRREPTKLVIVPVIELPPRKRY